MYSLDFANFAATLHYVHAFKASYTSFAPEMSKIQASPREIATAYREIGPPLHITNGKSFTYIECRLPKSYLPSETWAVQSNYRDSTPIKRHGGML